jgi:hypothetical protein
MRPLLALPLILAACGQYVPPCQDESGHVPFLSCERGTNDRTVAERPPHVNPDPPDDPDPPDVDDPEPPHETIDDPDYRAWRERQGRPLP